MSGVKKYFYFTGLPRCGNTLLSAILNENSDIFATGHSFLPDLFFSIKNSEQNSVRFKNYPCKNNPNFFINERYKFLDHSTLFTDEIETKCDLIMDKDLYINKMLFSIYQLKKNNQIKDFLIIDYNDLVKNYKTTIDKIYDYYEIPTFNHNFKNFKNKLIYNDSVLGADMHKIRTDEIKKLNNDIILPKNVINKYGHLNSILFD